MVEDAYPILVHCLRQYSFLEFECLGGIQIVAHYPREGDVVSGGDEVGEAVEYFAAAVEAPGLHGFGVAADGFEL